MPFTETAYAKINLALHVRARRADGYHQLETLFAFVDAGDWLSAEPDDHDTVISRGEFGGVLDDPLANIVLQALAVLPHGPGWRVELEKNLPVAAGLGGGSADAGALFRLVQRAVGLPADWPMRAAALGADVPACVESRTVIGRGTGTELTPGPDDLAGCPVLLVNPRVALSTGPVFRGWDGVDLGPLPEGTARDIALMGRNDLETPAKVLCPAVGEVLGELSADAPWLVRMSGSGATCFALYDSVAARDAAAARIAAARPGWWQLAGALR